jgi:hypothetical protein
VERQSTIEVLEFYAAGSETGTSGPTSGVTDLRAATPGSEEDPGTGS